MSRKRMAAFTCAALGLVLGGSISWIRFADLPSPPASNVDAPPAASAAPEAAADATADNLDPGDIEFLLARIARLEKTVEQLARAGVVDDLRSRISALESATRNRVAPVSRRDSANEISQLKRQQASLKQEQTRLASQISGARNQATPTMNDLRVLQQKVFSLETRVNGVENRF